MTRGLHNKLASVIGRGSGLGRATARASALGTLPALYAWAVRSMLRRNLCQLWAGDTGPLYGLYAEDVRLVLSGRQSLTGDYRGENEVERWMRRFVRVGVQLEP